MLELFGVIFVTSGFIFEFQEGFGLPTGAPRASSFYLSIFGYDFGVQFDSLLASKLGSFFDSFSTSSFSTLPHYPFFFAPAYASDAPAARPGNPRLAPPAAAARRAAAAARSRRESERPEVRG